MSRSSSSIDASGMQTVKTADSSTVSRDDAVIAIGNALGRFGEPSVVTGTVTALHQEITAGDGAEQETLSDMIRIAAAIQPGDSGGALLNLDGAGHRDQHGRRHRLRVGRFGSQSGTTGFAIPDREGPRDRPPDPHRATSPTGSTSAAGRCSVSSWRNPTRGSEPLRAPRSPTSGRIHRRQTPVSKPVTRSPRSVATRSAAVTSCGRPSGATTRATRSRSRGSTRPATPTAPR